MKAYKTMAQAAKAAGVHQPVIRISMDGSTREGSVLYIVGPADLEAVRDTEIMLFAYDSAMDMKKGHLAAIF